MNRLFKIFFIFIFVLAGVNAVNAQIEVVSSDYRYEPGNDLSKQRSIENIEVDLGESGADQHWDFSGIELEGDYSNYIEHIGDPDGKPGADSFATANICVWEENEASPYTVYAYMNVNEDHFNHLGMTYTMSGSDSAAMIFQVETIGNALSFPIAFNDEWEYVLNFSDDEDWIDRDSVHCIVDAWGTITDLAGTFNCLRVQRYTREFEQHEEGMETDTNYEYFWVVPDFGEIVRITGQKNEEEPDFTSGSFTRLTGVEMTGISSRTETEIPVLTCLEPAYPNPFNPNTTLRFKMAQRGMVTIDIYDISGRIVASLLNSSYSPGSYSVDFNGVNLGSGVYFAKFSAGNTTETQRLLLTK
ncbi:T9SS type A sorting domain-containing protein [bacterium]|nr:T9SS type A sorting domain-containing protein [bacterium]